MPNRYLAKVQQFPPLLLPHKQIDDPATPDMRPVASAVEQDIRIRAAGFLQRIGEDRHAVKCAVGVDARCYGDDFGC